MLQHITYYILHITCIWQDDDMDDFDDDFLGNLSQQELRDKQVSLVRTHTHTPPPPPPPPPPCTDRYALIDKNVPYDKMMRCYLLLCCAVLEPVAATLTTCIHLTYRFYHVLCAMCPVLCCAIRSVRASISCWRSARPRWSRCTPCYTSCPSCASTRSSTVRAHPHST